MTFGNNQSDTFKNNHSRRDCPLQEGCGAHEDLSKVSKLSTNNANFVDEGSTRREQESNSIDNTIEPLSK